MRKEFQLVSKPGATCVFSDGRKHGCILFQSICTWALFSLRITVWKVSFLCALVLRARIFTFVPTTFDQPAFAYKAPTEAVSILNCVQNYSSDLVLGTPQHPSNWKRLTGFYTRCLKKILRLPIEKWAQSNEQVFLEAQMLDVRARLAVDRLLYAQRVFAVGPFFLQNVIHLEESTVTDPWLAGLKADLQWMQDIDPTVLPEGWSVDLTDLIEAWQTEGFHGSPKSKQFARKHQMQEQTMEEVANLHRQAFAVLKQAGPLSSLIPFTLCQRLAVMRVSVGLVSCLDEDSWHIRDVNTNFSLLNRPFLQGAICLHCGRFLLDHTKIAATFSLHTQEPWV